MVFFKMGYSERIMKEKEKFFLRKKCVNKIIVKNIILSAFKQFHYSRRIMEGEYFFRENEKNTG